MFGKRTKGILLALTVCDDPSQEAGFVEWYEKHLDDMLATGLCQRASLYDLVTPGTCEPYLAIYETDDPARMARDLVPSIAQQAKDGLIHPAARALHRIVMETMEPGIYPFPGKDLACPTGLLLMANNPKTPGTDDAFNAWYDNVHRLDIEATGIYTTMNRFRAVEVGGDGVRYANLYETALDDVSVAPTGLDDFRPKWAEAGTLYADRVNTLRGAYRLHKSVSTG